MKNHLGALRNLRTLYLLTSIFSFLFVGLFIYILSEGMSDFLRDVFDVRIKNDEVKLSVNLISNIILLPLSFFLFINGFIAILKYKHVKQTITNTLKLGDHVINNENKKNTKADFKSFYIALGITFITIVFDKLYYHITSGDGILSILIVFLGSYFTTKLINRYKDKTLLIPFLYIGILFVFNLLMSKSFHIYNLSGYFIFSLVALNYEFIEFEFKEIKKTKAVKIISEILITIFFGGVFTLLGFFKIYSRYHSEELMISLVSLPFIIITYYLIVYFIKNYKKLAFLISILLFVLLNNIFFWEDYRLNFALLFLSTAYLLSKYMVKFFSRKISKES